MSSVVKRASALGPSGDVWALIDPPTSIHGDELAARADDGDAQAEAATAAHTTSGDNAAALVVENTPNDEGHVKSSAESDAAVVGGSTSAALADRGEVQGAQATTSGHASGVPSHVSDDKDDGADAMLAQALSRLSNAIGMALSSK